MRENNKKVCVAKVKSHAFTCGCAPMIVDERLKRLKLKKCAKRKKQTKSLKAFVSAIYEIKTK